MFGDTDNVLKAAQLLPGDGIDQELIKESIKTMLEAFGEDARRDGLLNTPERVSRMYVELLGGYRMDPVGMVNNAIFDVEYDQMVIVQRY